MSRCAGFALFGSEAIGKQVLDHIGDSVAVLLKKHGVFAIGKSTKSGGQVWD